jgi:hypothetical protein
MGGIRSGVNGTPTFFINGVRHDGAYDYASLVAGIQVRLAAEGGIGAICDSKSLHELTMISAASRLPEYSCNPA